jgi:lysophospholipase L1-like esterase
MGSFSRSLRRSALAASVAIAACGGGTPPTTPGPAPTDTNPGPDPAPPVVPPGKPNEAKEGAAAASAEAPAGAKSTPAEPSAEQLGPAFPPGAKVLVIGDSFAQSLGVGLKTLEAEQGFKTILKGEQSTYIPEWAGAKRDVPGLLRQYKPDLVVISLGGNELAMLDPTIRGPRVKELVGHMGSIPCIWVAPALWGNKETGLLEVIKSNSSPCRHFDSNRLTPDLPRGGDKIHPNPEGQRRWAKALVDWIRAERDRSRETFGLRPRPAGE